MLKKCRKILEHHFATVTHEKFLANLEEFWPEFFFCEESNYLELEQANDPALDRQSQELRTRS
jgi:hypothetical protein